MVVAASCSGPDSRTRIRVLWRSWSWIKVLRRLELGSAWTTFSSHSNSWGRKNKFCTGPPAVRTCPRGRRPRPAGHLETNWCLKLFIAWSPPRQKLFKCWRKREQPDLFIWRSLIKYLFKTWIHRSSFLLLSAANSFIQVKLTLDSFLRLTEINIRLSPRRPERFCLLQLIIKPPPSQQNRLHQTRLGLHGSVRRSSSF